ncbi:NAD-binding protein [Laetiporus sulphureus 93-53]|uniref:NAD-binding protein n=1 Tax=Laetiporus sulphureus 93-53 TaxID=1314785 RepID=A0A165GDY1_9APHY|nr:NAD-binding protein [Laetiporus sulphureus 93-53]KZT10213.1 NAD-binding protein [Laetiporus sulphureus 93-53]
MVSVGRIALITGASQGIGRAIALRLAEDGLDVAVNDIQSKHSQLEAVVAEIKAKGRNAIAVPADVSKDEEVKTMVAQTAERLGGLDVMVANAGILLTKLLVDTSVEEWDRVMAINARSVFLAYKYAAKQMIAQGRGGRIIGASSVAGRMGCLDLGAYTASKFAVHGLTQTGALELAKYNITVNAYAPGLIKTPMTVSEEEDKRYGGAPGAAAKVAFGLPNMPDAGPEVVASLVSYLAKPESYFITGQTISMNGGVCFD